MFAVSYCGKYLIREASVEDAKHVLSDLSREEAAERKRLGLSEDFATTYEQVALGRARIVTPASRPYTPVILFGASKDGFVWLLPSQFAVERYGRMLANKKLCRWMIDHCFEIIDKDGGTRDVLFNGVTPDAVRIINWLKKSCRALFSNTPVPIKASDALVLPFFIYRHN